MRFPITEKLIPAQASVQTPPLRIPSVSTGNPSRSAPTSTSMPGPASASYSEIFTTLPPPTGFSPTISSAATTTTTEFAPKIPTCTSFLSAFLNVFQNFFILTYKFERFSLVGLVRIQCFRKRSGC